MLILLEAKGGEVPPKTWKDPKELVYYRFLKECPAFRKKGFYYIVPQRFGDRCQQCLREYFPPTDNIKCGTLLWEDLLPMISHELLGCAVDSVIRELQGVKALREYQRDVR